MIRVADYIVKYLEEYGIRHIFMISGGGAMHLNDAIGRSKKIKYICNHHEQASAIAAEGYSRVANKLSVVNVTSGPGGTNSLTGVIGQWLDSVPVLYISGQVKFETTIQSCPELGLRQLGDQEINITDIVRPITKYSTMIVDPNNIKLELEKAIFIATSGRPGPVWLDIPLNVQGALIDENKLDSWNCEDDHCVPDISPAEIDEVLKCIEMAERPVVIAGHGIRIAKAQEKFIQLVNKMNIPVLTTFNGFDLIPSDHDLYIGRIGTLGTRAGNFALQNADLVLCIGTRNNIRQSSYDWKKFARSAKKIVIDIDKTELKKPTVIPDLAINADAMDFINRILAKLSGGYSLKSNNWNDWCLGKKKKFPAVLETYKHSEKINPYFFIEALTQKLNDGDIVVAGNGTACVALFQAGIVKGSQRMFWNSGCASMGYDLPAAIGACVAAEKDVFCLAGDGSLMMNLQELQTVAYNNMPVKIIILNNNGYISIKQTQNSFFNGNLVACGEESGVGFPNFIKLAEAFGIRTLKVEKTSEANDKLLELLSIKGPVVCEVILDDNYIFQPKLSSLKTSDGRMISKPLEDMFPFLDREEFNNNMLVDLVSE